MYPQAILHTGGYGFSRLFGVGSMMVGYVSVGAPVRLPIRSLSFIQPITILINVKVGSYNQTKLIHLYYFI